MTRPLPQLTVDNEFFWTAGAEGELRILGCQDCTALIHPPQPVCRYCRSHHLAPRTVSGRGTLAGFTVNHRFSQFRLTRVTCDSSFPGMPGCVG